MKVEILVNQLSKLLVIIFFAFNSTQQADARVGGSRSMSRSAPPVHHEVAPSSPQRAGGGSNAGMQRPETMDKVRANESAPVVNPAAPVATGLPPSASAPLPGQPRQGMGMGTVLGAAAAGAAVGYLANSAMHDNGVPQTAGGATSSYGDPLVSGNAPVEHGLPWGGILMFVLGTAAVVGLLMFLTRKQASGAAAPVGGSGTSADRIFAAPSSAQAATGSYVSDALKSEIEPFALKYFNALQLANNRGDIAFIEAQVVDPLRQELMEDIRHRTNPSDTQVMMMDASLVDVSNESGQQIASVRFRGMVRENAHAAPDRIDEVWHFVRSESSTEVWKLAGIEQV